MYIGIIRAVCNFFKFHVVLLVVVVVLVNFLGVEKEIDLENN